MQHSAMLSKPRPVLTFVLSVCAAALVLPACAAEQKLAELGDVDWLRGYQSAVTKSRKESKPLLVLFQEVPGCSTCRNYGQNVLRHPLIVEAARSLFVPVVVYNNTKGDDAAVLKKFNEPSWSNPVVRIMSAEGKLLADRVAGDYTIAGLSGAMVDALRKTGNDVPSYLQLLAEEAVADRKGTQKATFAMHCFWEGEGQLGQLDGVIATRPGLLGGKEVVEIKYNPGVTSFDQLLLNAKRVKCASKVFARTDEQEKSARAAGHVVSRSDERIRPDQQPKYYLSRTALRFVPMTELQAARANALLFRRKDPKAVLSRGQRELLAEIAAHPDAKWVPCIGTADMIGAWEQAQKVMDFIRRSGQAAASSETKRDR